jgi:hypothetical protein
MPSGEGLAKGGVILIFRYPHSVSPIFDLLKKIPTKHLLRKWFHHIATKIPKLRKIGA